jgi:hypothetical protein
MVLPSTTKLPNKMEGDFTFVKHKEDKEILEDFFNAIYVADAWDYIAEGPSGGRSFSESSDPELFEIVNYLQYKHYSAVTFDFMMAKMQRIALQGWASFVEHWKSIDE